MIKCELGFTRFSDHHPLASPFCSSHTQRSSLPFARATWNVFVKCRTEVLVHNPCKLKKKHFVSYSLATVISDCTETQVLKWDRFARERMKYHVQDYFGGFFFAGTHFHSLLRGIIFKGLTRV